MNPLVLVGLGLFAAMALGRKRSGAATSNGGGGNGGGANGGGANGGGGNDGNGQNGDGDGDGDGGVEVQIPVSGNGQPVPGTFYQISDVDLSHDRNPIDALAAAIVYRNPGMVAAPVMQYRECIQNDWGLWLYGEDVESAFHRRNNDAIAALEAGVWPEPVPPDATARDNFGLLWLPRYMVGDQQGQLLGGGMSGAPLPSLPPVPEHGENVACIASTALPPAELLNSLSGYPPGWALMPGGQV